MRRNKRQEIAERLCGTSVFGMLSAGEISEIIDASEFRSYRSGETIGDGSACLPVIISGKAAVLGNEPQKSGVVIRLLSAGSVFGVSHLFSERGGEISTVRAEGEAEALLIPQSVISELIHKNGDFAEGYIRLLVGKIRFLGSRIAAFTAGSAEARLIRHLLSLRSDEDVGESERGITLECSLSRLADMLNIGRASLYRAINSLEEKGIISHTDRHITVLDGDALKKML